MSAAEVIAAAMRMWMGSFQASNGLDIAVGNAAADALTALKAAGFAIVQLPEPTSTQNDPPSTWFGNGVGAYALECRNGTTLRRVVMWSGLRDGTQITAENAREIAASLLAASAAAEAS